MLTATRLVVRLACLAALLIATPALAQNVLNNPGFELGAVGGGAAGWTTFGNVYTEAADGGCIVAHTGNQICKLFGNWWGVFNVSGLFQNFPTTPGTTWQLSSHSRICSGDPMLGTQATGGNWVVQKIVFRDAADNEIGAAESTILEGNVIPDLWFGNTPIQATAPAGTVIAQAFILYLQPLYDGGAAQVDDIDFRVVEQPTPARASSWGQIKALYR